MTERDLYNLKLHDTVDVYGRWGDPRYTRVVRVPGGLLYIPGGFVPLSIVSDIDTDTHKYKWYDANPVIERTD